MSTNDAFGELISKFFEVFLEMYGDEDLAAVATAAVINDLLNEVGDGEVTQ